MRGISFDALSLRLPRWILSHLFATVWFTMSEIRIPHFLQTAFSSQKPVRFRLKQFFLLENLADNRVSWSQFLLAMRKACPNATYCMVEVWIWEIVITIGPMWGPTVSLCLLNGIQFIYDYLWVDTRIQIPFDPVGAHLIFLMRPKNYKKPNLRIRNSSLFRQAQLD